jgi:hypothetical protein
MLSGDTLPDERVTEMCKTTARMAAVLDVEPEAIMRLCFQCVNIDYGSVRSRHVRLRKGGPNDGLTLLADELLPNGIAVIEPGIDHFYAAPDIEVKSVALANVVAAHS